MGPRSLDGDAVSHRRVFDHARAGFARLTKNGEICEACKDGETITRDRQIHSAVSLSFLTKPLNLRILR